MSDKRFEAAKAARDVFWRIANAETKPDSYSLVCQLGHVVNQILSALTAPEDAGERDADDDYVAWCRYTDRSIVTCDSDEEGAFRVYRRGDKTTIDQFNQMSDCLDDIRISLEDTSFKSVFNRLEAIRRRINFPIPDTATDLLRRQRNALLFACKKVQAIADQLPHTLADVKPTLDAAIELSDSSAALTEQA